MPVLVVRDRFTKAIFSHLVPAKGTEHYYPEIALLRDIKFLGYTSLTLKSDQEPSIIALAAAVKNTLSSQGISVQCSWRTAQKEIAMVCQTVKLNHRWELHKV